MQTFSVNQDKKAITIQDKLMKMLIAFGLLFSTPLYAEEVVSSLYNCTHKDTSLVRQVMITHQYPGCHGRSGA